MSGWFGHNRKKSPRPGLTGSGSVERAKPSSSNDVWLEGDGGQGMNNPLAWDKMPSVLQEKFPHWKDSPLTVKKSSQSSDSDVDPSYSCYKSGNKQQPDYTFPYVVMDTDTLNSIAVKFETTPTELARLNKKPSGLSTAIFTGEVLYVPDHDEIARSAPKSAPPALRADHPSPLPGSLESQDTLRSSSVSHHPPNSEEEEEEVCGGNGNGGGGGGGGGGGNGGGDPLTPDHSPPSSLHEVEISRDLFEEVTDTHFVLLSRYISDDQGCIHGKLMINRTVLIFTPFHDNPLVKEHGPAGFEIMIPLQDIMFAAFTKDVEQPHTRKRLNLEEGKKEEEKCKDEKEEEDVKKEETEDVKKEEKKKEEKKEEEKKEEKEEEKKEENKEEEKKEGENEEEEEGKKKKKDKEGALTEVNTGGESGEGGDDGVGEEVEQVTPNTEVEGSLSSELDPNGGNGGSLKEDVSSSMDSLPHRHHSCYHQSSQSHSASSTDELLAIMGAESSSSLPIQSQPSHTNSECSTESLSDHPCFLHVRVSHKSCASHTYTPINRAVGIDIPGNNPFSPTRGILQQVKTMFCFAVAEHRVLQLITFISTHHPNTGHTSCSWEDGIFEFINYESSSHEDLLFSDNHFQGAESSESWEVYSLKDESKYRHKIERMEVEGFLPLPVLSEPSQLMEDTHLRAISNNLPSAAVGHDWILVYSTFKHGISLRTLYRNMLACDLPESPVILLVRDDQHKLFGAAVTSPLQLSEKFYGTGESFLFSFESAGALKVYSWTGQNNYVVKGSSDGIFLGCGGGHTGLWLDEYLFNGTSQPCSTFENDCLSSKEEFTCTGVEAWGFM